MKNHPGNAEPQLGLNDRNAELGLGAPGGATPRWYSRGYLPHFDNRTRPQSITFRLADSLPKNKLVELEENLATLPKDQQEPTRRRAIEKWLDSGMGCCALGHKAVARVMEATLLKFDGDRYRLFAWCIMPNHVHVLIDPHAALGKIVQSWKSFTGRWALSRNAELGLGVPGPAFWMREYWDRYIRNEDHFKNAMQYIHHNPVTAGLCDRPSQWPWSSARYATTPGNAEPQLGPTTS